MEDYFYDSGVDDLGSSGSGSGDGDSWGDWGWDDSDFGFDDPGVSNDNSDFWNSLNDYLDSLGQSGDDDWWTDVPFSGENDPGTDPADWNSGNDDAGDGNDGSISSDDNSSGQGEMASVELDKFTVTGTRGDSGDSGGDSASDSGGGIGSVSVDNTTSQDNQTDDPWNLPAVDLEKIVVTAPRDNPDDTDQTNDSGGTGLAGTDNTSSQQSGDDILVLDKFVVTGQKPKDVDVQINPGLIDLGVIELFNDDGSDEEAKKEEPEKPLTRNKKKFRDPVTGGGPKGGAPKPAAPDGKPAKGPSTGPKIIQPRPNTIANALAGKKPAGSSNSNLLWLLAAGALLIATRDSKK